MRMRRRHRNTFYGGRGAFDPTSLGVVGAWFDVAEASDAGSGLAFTLPNQLTANHATTSTDARKPTISTASNGVPILVCSASCLQVPLHAAINSATKFWMAAHFRITTAAGNPVPFSMDFAGGGGASSRKFFAQRFSGDRAHVFNAASTEARAFGPASLWPTNTWVHCICELNLDSGGTEAERAVWSIDGVPVVSTFSNSTGTPGNMPASMPTPTGFMNLFAQSASTGGNSWVGEIGRHILVGTEAMADATTGCLTPAARLALSDFDRPE